MDNCGWKQSSDSGCLQDTRLLVLILPAAPYPSTDPDPETSQCTCIFHYDFQMNMKEEYGPHDSTFQGRLGTGRKRKFDVFAFVSPSVVCSGLPSVPIKAWGIR